MKNILYLIIIFLLVNSGGGMLFVLAKNPMTIILLLLLLLYWLITKKRTNPNKAFLCLVLFTVLICMNALFAIGGQSINTYGYFFLTLLIAFFASITVNPENFVKILLKVLTFYKYQAIFGFLVSLLMANQFSIIDLGDERIYHTFYYLCYFIPESDRSIGSFQLLRNQGLFWEPGILQIYMNILLFLQLFVFRVRTISIAMTLFVIGSTFSTSGYIISMVLFLYKYKSMLTVKKFIIYTPVFIVFIAILFPFVKANIEDKLTGEHAMSAQVRLFDTLQSIVIISDYPLTGIGLTIEAYQSLQGSYKQVLDMYSYNPEGNTNSILSLFVFFGFPVGLLMIYGLYRQTLIADHKGIFFLIIFLALLAEPLLLRVFFIFFIFNGLIDMLLAKKSMKKLRKF